MANFDWLPSLPVLLAYSAAVFLIAITPGPDMALFISRTLAGGRRAGFAAMFGAVSGLVIHALLAAFGLSALLAASTTAFSIVKIAGAFYLLWLALGAIRHGSSFNVAVQPQETRPLKRDFLVGLGINLTNPKVVMFFVTFLPQFVDAGDASASARLLFLGLWFLAIGMPVSAAIIFMADRFTALMQNSPRLMRSFDYGFAALMVAFAVRLVLAR
jgi:threonine/homoserine/homoserine lactone efflux protein